MKIEKFGSSDTPALLNSRTSRDPAQQHSDLTFRRTPAPPPSRPIHSSSHPLVSPYALRHGRGYWLLTFEGESTILKHEQALYYVAWLLAHPHAEPIHALNLAARAVPFAPGRSPICQLPNTLTGQPVLLDSTAVVQQLSLSLDDARAMRSVLRQQHELEALLDDEDQTEPVKAEAARELVSLYEYEKQHSRKIRDTAAKAADAVGRAFSRLYGLYKGAFLKAVSVGFTPIRWLDASGQEHRAAPATLSTLNSQPSTPSPCHRRFLEQELLEVSAVSIPANPNALVLGLKSGAVDSCDLHELAGLITRTLQASPLPAPDLLLHHARELNSLLKHL